MKYKTVSLKEMQKIELDILIYLKNVCDENDLKYYLAYGTLIGAVRHKGFIPWDDDVDVLMPREDYKHLVQIMQEQPHPYYRLISTDTNHNFTAPLPKIIDSRTTLIQHYDYVEKVQLGVYIDILILDGLPNNYEKAVDFHRKSEKLYRSWQRADAVIFPPGKSKLYGLLRAIRNIPYKIYGIRRTLMDIERNNSQYSFYTSYYVADFYVQNPEKSIMKAKWFGDGTDIFFEGQIFRAPLDYDTILHKVYGDYMTPPPKERQVSQHQYTVYWKQRVDK